MKYLIIIVFLFFCVQLEAQETRGSKIIFHSQNSFGLIEGENGSSVSVGSVNGVGYGGWFAGIGGAIDHYLFRTFPVYFHLQKEWSIKLPLFAYASAGQNGPWVKQTVSIYNDGYKSKFYPGRYYEGGIGYRFPMKKTSLLFSLAYEEKNLREKQREQVFCLMPPCPDFYRTFEHRMQTLVLKAGVRL
jgi:hypothetical protein